MIAIVVSEFNKKVTTGLLRGCLNALDQHQIQKNQIVVTYVPGAFEIPAKINKLVLSKKYDCLIALGCIIKGETDHYHYISNAVTNGLMKISIKGGPPIIFGILTCQNADLAIARSGKKNKQNKGYEAGLAAIEQLKD
tara:strand:- start:90184 stop:90597 length:414 start_codon:yes stop_codon:yes gene_type:complete